MTRRFLRAALGVLSANEKNAVLVRRAVDEIWNAGNIDLADELFSSTYVNHGGLIPDLVSGPEGVKFSVALYRTAFPGLHIRVDGLSPVEGTVQMRWTAQSMSPDHRVDVAGTLDAERGFSGVTRCSVAGGQIVESWTSWDSAVATQAVGLSAKHEETS